jgi:chromosome partition protein MukE
MSEHPYQRLEQVIEDELFPGVDLALRHGRHIDQDDVDRYEFLREAQPILETFYRRFGCELTYSAEGFFWLRPEGSLLGRRHLSVGEMLVGQALALLLLDPGSVRSGGRIDRREALHLLEKLVGEERLLVSLNPRRRRSSDDMVAQEIARKEIDKALRGLASLGFIDLLEDGLLRLRTPLLRFAEPVRGAADRDEALRRLIAEGKVEELAVEEDEG